MHVIPAIDLYRGRAVRLLRGDYEQVTDFGDPRAWLEQWRDLGAHIVHVVDLEGARDGKPIQLNLVRELAGAGVPLQVGGGIRGIEDMKVVWDSGVTRMVLGTQAAERPEIVEQAVSIFGEGIVVALDARDGRAATRGWLDTSEVLAVDLAQRLQDVGVQRFVVTDISRDGTLTEPNYELLTEVMKATGKPVIASGGVSSVEALSHLNTLGVEAAIVGRALYEGTLTLGDAQQASHAG